MPECRACLSSLCWPPETTPDHVCVAAVALMCRNAPAKKYLAGGFALSAGAAWAFVKWCVSASIPGFFEILFSPAGVWYVIITGAAGVGVTYWIDNPAHYKLHNTIWRALQLVALGFVYSSIADQGLAIAVVLALICYDWLYGLFR